MPIFKEGDIITNGNRYYVISSKSYDGSKYEITQVIIGSDGTKMIVYGSNGKKDKFEVNSITKDMPGYKKVIKGGKRRTHKRSKKTRKSRKSRRHH